MIRMIKVQKSYRSIDLTVTVTIAMAIPVICYH
jgi:hypothetical protein